MTGRIGRKNKEQTMYMPKHFEEPRTEIMHDLIRSRPLATLVTLSASGLNANHIPLHLSEDPAPFGTLRGHVARANPMWQDIVQDVEALAVFHGPEAYISPSWYPTKKATGKVVPTWNYVVVHACGDLRVVDDALWLRELLEKLVSQNEKQFSKPWALQDAPADFIEKMIGAIVGIEIVITRLSGKWKASQNQPAENREGVIQGLRKSDLPDAAGMANMIRIGN
jgi:transcriptional regulator